MFVTERKGIHKMSTRFQIWLNTANESTVLENVTLMQRDRTQQHSLRQITLFQELYNAVRKYLALLFSTRVLMRDLTIQSFGRCFL
jgi:hypothetical protein